MQIALIQTNPILGALEANRATLVQRAHEAEAAGARLIVFPELALCGYPPEDLILKDHFCSDCEKQLALLESELPPAACVVVGAPIMDAGQRYNAALVFLGGRRIGTYRKMHLPNYGVFDEKRLFTAGNEPFTFILEGVRIGLHICEDSWDPAGAAVRALASCAPDLAINLSASPYHRGKLRERTAALAQSSRALHAPLLYCNLVGGQDELVFDGASMGFDATGHVFARAKQFAEDRLLCEPPIPSRIEPVRSDLDEVYEALKLGLRDYVEKLGFQRVVVALSGGIDSALVLAIAVDALGADRVAAVTMPSQHSSKGTLRDAVEMAEHLGVEFHTLPIQTLYDALHGSLNTVWGADKPAGLAEENLQARIRGLLIMALSNEFGWLVLTTGNKSEVAMGYCTLYGDMAGGFALIKDVPKTLVFELCRWRNEQGTIPVIPPSIISRPPSAELRPNQKDTDSLPPYDVLDPLLEDYVEKNLGIDSLIAAGHDEALVRRVVRSVECSEYKRRQSAPGVKITPRAFGRDRRMPIINHYRN